MDIEMHLFITENGAVLNLAWFVGLAPRKHEIGLCDLFLSGVPGSIIVSARDAQKIRAVLGIEEN
jgi:hypothetical protein